MENHNRKSFFLNHVGFCYQGMAKNALVDVESEFHSGVFHAVIGASGSGKSTLLKLLAGIEKPSTGSILYGGTPVTDIPAKRRNFGVVFQDCPLFPERTVDAVIKFPLVNGRTARKGYPIESILEQLRISELRCRKPTDLSGGERQRVALARVLVWSPDVLLLDEPLSAVDHDLRPELVRLIKKFQEESGCTVFYVTHDQLDVFSAADNVVVMSEGSLQQQATPQDIYTSPLNFSVGRLVGDGPLFTVDATLVGLDREGRALLEIEGASIVGEAVDPVGEKLMLRSRVSLGLRPENLVLNSSATKGGVLARVKKNFFRGSRFLVELDFSESALFVWADTPCLVGEAIYLTISGRVPVFDFDTRLRVLTCSFSK